MFFFLKARAYEEGFAHAIRCSLPTVWECAGKICWGYDNESIPEEDKAIYAENYIRGYRRGLAAACPN